MMNIGETFEMNVVRIESNEYGSRIILSYDGCDTYRVKAYDFQAEGDIPSTIKVRVKDINRINGFPDLVQDNEWVLKQTFEYYGLVGRNYEFEITDKRVDNKSNRPFLCLKDDFGIRFHRFYINDGDSYNIGDKIRLHIKALKSNYLDLEKPQERTRISVNSSPIFTTRETIDDAPISSSVTKKTTIDHNIVFTDTESLTLEYKSSIVYDSNSNKVEVDKQIRKILKAIAGFMNAEGGTLYIGVCKNGSVRGIENDYPHLNDSDADEFAGQYPANIDGFELKIRNSVSQYLSSLAGALFDFSTEKHQGKTIAKISVSKAYAPIYYNGNVVFQRQGNRTVPLKDNALTHFCASKWFGGADAIVSNSQNVNGNNGHRNVIIENENVVRDYSLWHTLYLHKNGGWSFDNNAQKDRGNSLGEVVCSCNIENYRIKEKHYLLFAYDSGNIDAVICDKKETWAKNKQGWSKNGYHVSQGIQNIFCANPMDMVALFYEQENKSYVKIVDISCISTHDNFGNKGNELVPIGAENCKIFHIHHKYHDALRGLTRAQRNYKGYDIDNEQSKRPLIQKLQEIVREEYGVVFE